MKGFGCRPVMTYPLVLRAGVRKPSSTLSFHQPLRGLRCDAEVFVLMEDRVLRVFVIVLVPEDANSAVFDVAVLVEADRPLQCFEIGGLDCVAHGVAVDRLARS